MNYFKDMLDNDKFWIGLFIFMIIALTCIIAVFVYSLLSVFNVINELI